ncbi:MAG: hypothetical protein CMJ75_18710 [Planctomycetaceae bacterium]|nr:hypothetical protein [Planctomycetaceae bacterium]
MSFSALEAVRLFIAIVLVESGGDPTAVGDGGEAIGIAQIRPILVEDVNRIEGEERFKHSDALNPLLAFEMFVIYSEHYADHTDDYSPEGIARRWNGGPTGHEKEATKAYWAKVNLRFTRHNDGRISR